MWKWKEEVLKFKLLARKSSPRVSEDLSKNVIRRVIVNFRMWYSSLAEGNVHFQIPGNGACAILEIVVENKRWLTIYFVCPRVIMVNQSYWHLFQLHDKS